MNALLFLVLAYFQAPACTGKLATAGCHSFAELYESRDSDIIYSLTSPHMAYVCFRPEEDSFIIISYTPPAAGRFKKVQYAYSAYGYISFSVYANGVRDRSHLFTGDWISEDEQGSGKTFSTKENPKLPDDYAGVSDSEISLVYSFVNVSGSKTIYSLKMRRSTLRFQENVQGKIKGEPFSLDVNGYCVAF